MSSTTTSSSESRVLPKKRLRLSQSNSDGVLEWAVDLHVPIGAHVTCVPSGGHLLVEEVDENCEVIRESIEDVPPPIKQASPKEEAVSEHRCDTSDEESAPPEVYLREEVTPKDVLHQTVCTPPSEKGRVPIYWTAGASTTPSTNVVPRVFREQKLAKQWEAQVCFGEEGARAVALVPTGRQSMAARTGLRSAPATPVKRPWTAVGRRRDDSEGAATRRRQSNNEASAPKSRVHFTADGSIPVCRMPNCRRPMYFYKNEDRWRCNLNRGGCGAVFHNVGRDIGPCSKCQRPIGEEHPCYEWCVCRYCSSSKKQQQTPSTESTAKSDHDPPLIEKDAAPFSL